MNICYLRFVGQNILHHRLFIQTLTWVITLYITIKQHIKLYLVYIGININCMEKQLSVTKRNIKNTDNNITTMKHQQ